MAVDVFLKFFKYTSSITMLCSVCGIDNLIIFGEISRGFAVRLPDIRFIVGVNLGQAIGSDRIQPTLFICLCSRLPRITSFTFQILPREYIAGSAGVVK